MHRVHLAIIESRPRLSLSTIAPDIFDIWDFEDRTPIASVHRRMSVGSPDAHRKLVYTSPVAAFIFKMASSSSNPPSKRRHVLSDVAALSGARVSAARILKKLHDDGLLKDTTLYSASAEGHAERCKHRHL